MLSLWPAGLPSNGEGTINWAGGLINWNSPYMQNGYYYAMVQDVNVQCYDPPSGANIQGSKSYIYTDAAGTNNTVQITDNIVVLKGLSGTGENPGVDTSTQTGTKPSVTPESVPGVSGAGARGDDTSGGNAASSGSGTASGAAAAATNTAASGGFSQGTTGKSGGSRVEEKVGGSVFAVIVAVVVALCW